MVTVIPFKTLGHQKHVWLEARHHFSFARYYDPQRMGYPPLRVWNDDTIKPGTGFPMHPHQDMEIITYIRQGAITHEDSLGNRGRTTAGNVQVMSAGSGIIHSEHNLEDEETILFQIWIETRSLGIEPRWETRPFPKGNCGQFEVLASGRIEDKETPALKINQDAALLAATMNTGEALKHTLGKNRHAYLVPSVGQIRVNGSPVNERDGVAIRDEENILAEALTGAEIIMTDLPVI